MNVNGRTLDMSEEQIQKFIDATWPFILRAMECDKSVVKCGYWPDHVPLTEAGGSLTVGDLRRLRDAYLFLVQDQQPRPLVSCD